MNRGFTLVELLAVIIILSSLVLLVSVAVTGIVKNAKKDISEAQVKLIKSATKTWAGGSLDRLPDEEKCAYLTLEDLKYVGLLESSIIDSNTGKEIPDDTKIKITASKSSNNLLIYDYEVGSEDISMCSRIPFGITGIIYVSSKNEHSNEPLVIGHSINRQTTDAWCGTSGSFDSCIKGVGWDTEEECIAGMAYAGYTVENCNWGKVTSGITSYETDPPGVNIPYFKHNVKDGILISTSACMRYLDNGDEKEACVKSGASDVYGDFDEIDSGSFVLKPTNPKKNVAVIDGLIEYFNPNTSEGSGCCIFGKKHSRCINPSISISAYSGGSVGVYTPDNGQCSFESGLKRSLCTNEPQHHINQYTSCRSEYLKIVNNQ